MRETDRKALAELLTQVASYYDRRLTPDILGLYFAGLADLEMAAVRLALNRHVQDPQAGQFMPKIADIRRQIEAAKPSDGHPGPDEAWSIAIQARDEDASVIWTDEIGAAFFAAAMPLLDEGDKIAARRAFIDRYEVEVAKARREGRPAKWTPSLGSNPELRRLAVEQAVQAGRIGQSQAANLLPAPKPTPNAVALLAGVREASRETDPDEARRKLAELRASLSRGRV